MTSVNEVGSGAPDDCSAVARAGCDEPTITSDPIANTTIPSASKVTHALAAANRPGTGPRRPRHSLAVNAPAQAKYEYALTHHIEDPTSRVDHVQDRRLRCIRDIEYASLLST